MSTAMESAGHQGNKLGLTPGLVVQELGWDSDVDDDVRVMIEDAVDSELIEEAMEAVDLVLLWWRDDDGDLVEGEKQRAKDQHRSQRMTADALSDVRPSRRRRYGRRRHACDLGRRRAIEARADQAGGNRVKVR